MTLLLTAEGGCCSDPSKVRILEYVVLVIYVFRGKKYVVLASGNPHKSPDV